MQSVVLVAKKNHAAASALRDRLALWLARRGICCSGILPARDRCDMAIVLGGDGTILGAARELAGSGTPILGINFGQVGFLAAVQPAQWESGVASALEGKLEQRSCLALKWRVIRSGLAVHEGAAINDVVVGRGALARLTTLGVSVDGHYMGRLRSDGLIVSSPLGSTGYLASAGGPLMSPSMEAVSLASICAFPAPVSPFVFPGSTRIEINVEPADLGGCSLTIDGQAGFDLYGGDKVEVRGWPNAVRIFGSEGEFFSRLGDRGFTSANL